MVENIIEDEWNESFHQEKKEEEPRVSKVIDLLDPSVPRASAELRQSRMNECKGCDRLKFGTLCSECNCVMKFKTWLEPAVCPLGKW